MTAKVKHFKTQSGASYGYAFTCPGCGRMHLLPVGPGDGGKYDRWTFDGNTEAPTFSPSILARWENSKGPRVCHSFVNAGRIQFLTDCTHPLAGQTVPLPDYEKDADINERDEA